MADANADHEPTLALTLLPLRPVAAAVVEDRCCPESREPPHVRGQEWTTAARAARRLAWFSLVWMCAEGAIGLAAGIRDASIALVAWALGSGIEGLASLIVIWRFTGQRTLSHTAEQKAQRAVALSFFLLAPYVAAEAIRDLVTFQHAAPSALGIAIAASSMVIMPVLGVAKQSLGRRLDSGATAGEGLQNLMCAAQAGAVLLGLLGTAAFGWSWLDPAIALVLAGWAVQAGLKAWRGEDCC